MIDDIKPDMPSKEGSNSRRRLLRSALATPVVLSTLVSKPVLGAVPYQCTMSGHVSGNLSRATDMTTCQTGSLSQGGWLLASSWLPSPISKGTLPDTSCSFASDLIQNITRVRGTDFNGFTGNGTVALTNAFFNVAANGSCSVTTTATLDPATMLQVLNTTDGSEAFQLGRTVVTSLLNFYKRGASSYPVSEAEIIDMFNAAIAGRRYQVNGSASWTPAEVIEYLQKLYPPPYSPPY
jgi:hypothetical protein